MERSGETVFPAEKISRYRPSGRTELGMFPARALGWLSGVWEGESGGGEAGEASRDRPCRGRAGYKI